MRLSDILAVVLINTENPGLDGKHRHETQVLADLEVTIDDAIINGPAMNTLLEYYHWLTLSEQSTR